MLETSPCTRTPGLQKACSSVLCVLQVLLSLDLTHLLLEAFAFNTARALLPLSKYAMMVV